MKKKQSIEKKSIEKKAFNWGLEVKIKDENILKKLKLIKR